MDTLSIRLIIILAVSVTCCDALRLPGSVRYGGLDVRCPPGNNRQKKIWVESIHHNAASKFHHVSSGAADQ